MSCKCIELVNEQLKSHNAVLQTRLCVNFKTGKSRLVLCLPVEKLNPKQRKPLPTFTITYCPICGKRDVSEEKAKKRQPEGSVQQ